MKKWKIMMVMLMCLILIQTAMGCKDQYDISENVIIIDMIEESGRDANCTIEIYNSTRFLLKDTMVQEDLLYTYNATKLPKETYTAFIECNQTTTQYIAECKFEVGFFANKLIISMIILMPMLLGFIFLIAGATLDNEHHKALKIFLFLTTVPLFFTSMHFGMLSVIKFYDFPELSDLIGSTTYWITIVFTIILIYFLMYTFTIITHRAAQNKEEKLKY